MTDKVRRAKWFPIARLTCAVVGQKMLVSDALVEAYALGRQHALEEAAEICQNTIAPFESYRHGTTCEEDAVLNCIELIRAHAKEQP